MFAEIEIDRETGFKNASRVCRAAAGESRITRFLKTETTKEFMSLVCKLPPSKGGIMGTKFAQETDLYFYRQQLTGGRPAQEVWVHPILFLEVARWLSHAFYLRVLAEMPKGKQAAAQRKPSKGAASVGDEDAGKAPQQSKGVPSALEDAGKEPQPQVRKNGWSVSRVPPQCCGSCEEAGLSFPTLSPPSPQCCGG